MSESTTLTKEERDRIFIEYDAAMRRGDLEAAREAAKKLPLHPSLAEFVREHYTPEAIKEAGFLMPSAVD